MANNEIKQSEAHGFLIFFDDVRVDHLVESFSTSVSVNGQYGQANINMYYTPDLDRITHKYNQENCIKYNIANKDKTKTELQFYLDDGVENMTNVRIFIKNTFSGYFVQVFEGNIRSKSSAFVQGKRTISFQAYDYMNWMNRIMCPWAIAMDKTYYSADLITWPAFGVDISRAKANYTTSNEAESKGMSIGQAINRVLQYTYLNNSFLSEKNSVLAWDKPLSRLELMGDISEDLRNENFWGYVIQTQATHLDSFYLKMQNILSNLIFEYFQDRDGLIRIKPPFWNSDVLYNSVIDSSMIESYNDDTNWNNWYTRVVCRGGADQTYSMTSEYSSALQALTPVAVATFAGEVVTQENLEAGEKESSGSSGSSSSVAVNGDMSQYYSDLSRMDLRVCTNYTEEKFKKMLQAHRDKTVHYGDMPSLADDYIKAEKKYGVNALFLYAKDGLESTYGTSPVARDKNNLSGWFASAGEFYRFDSREQCIDHVTGALSRNYLTASGAQFHGYTVKDVNVCYCTDGSDWTGGVLSIMKQVLSDSGELENYKNEVMGG